MMHERSEQIAKRKILVTGTTGFIGYHLAKKLLQRGDMEKSSKVKVVPSDISWSDVGSFDALFDELPKDENNNTQNLNHISIDSKNNLIYGSERKIATVDIEDCIIVDTGS